MSSKNSSVHLTLTPHFQQKKKRKTNGIRKEEKSATSLKVLNTSWRNKSEEERELTWEERNRKKAWNELNNRIKEQGVLTYGDLTCYFKLIAPKYYVDRDVLERKWFREYVHKKR